jgi:hypothetical protein
MVTTASHGCGLPRLATAACCVPEGSDGRRQASNPRWGAASARRAGSAVAGRLVVRMRHSVGAGRARRSTGLRNAKSARRIGARHAQSPSSTFSGSHRRREATEQRAYLPGRRRQRRPCIGSATAPRRCSAFEREADAASAVEAEVRASARRTDGLEWRGAARRAIRIAPKVDNRGAAAGSSHGAASTSALRQPCVQAFKTVVHLGRVSARASRRARRRGADGLVKCIGA